MEKCPWVFHYTLRQNLPGIKKFGLTPRVGLHATLDGHKVEKVFVMTSLYSCSMSACGMVDNHDPCNNLFGSKSDPESWQDSNIIILAIRKEGLEFYPDPGYEGCSDNPVAFYTFSSIPPESIEWLVDFGELESFVCCGKLLTYEDIGGGRCIKEDDDGSVWLYDWVDYSSSEIRADFLTQEYVCPECGKVYVLDCVTKL